MKGSILPTLLVFGFCQYGYTHDIGSTPTTWNREISRVTYQDAQPRAVAIKEAVLSRRMPPWGAVKGFGDFKNDQGLTHEELELFTDWIEGDTVKGNNPNALPKAPKFETPAGFKVPKHGIVVKGNQRVKWRLVLDGLIPDRIPERSSVQIVAVLPDGDVEPVVWLYEYKDAYRHSFLLRRPLDLPTGTEISGLPPDGSITLIPGKKKGNGAK